MKKILTALSFIILACFSTISQAEIRGPFYNPMFAGCSSGSDVVYNGNTITCGTGIATVGACGVSPSISGTNYEGAVTAGSGVLTACVINFSKTMSAIPKCIVTTTLGAVWITALSTTSMTVTAATLTSAIIYYKCWGAS